MVDRAIKEAWEDYRAEWLPDEHEREVLTPLAAAFEAGYQDASARVTELERERDGLLRVCREQAEALNGMHLNWSLPAEAFAELDVIESALRAVGE